MTTDPFTTADDRWDESPHHLADHCEHAGVGKACRRCRRKFDAASRWARDYLAAQEPTDAEVVAAARALAYWDGASGWDTPTWDGDITEAAYIYGARKALSAARAARQDKEKQ